MWDSCEGHFIAKYYTCCHRVTAELSRSRVGDLKNPVNHVQTGKPRVSEQTGCQVASLGVGAAPAASEGKGPFIKQVEWSPWTWIILTFVTALWMALDLDLTPESSVIGPRVTRLRQLQNPVLSVFPFIVFIYMYM